MTAATEARHVVDCTGIPITACSAPEAASMVLDLALADKAVGADIHLCNAYTLALANSTPAFGDLLRHAAVNFPDGQSVVWANRIRHRKLALPSRRVYGPDMFRDVLRRGQQVGLRHYLLGSTWDVLTSLEERLRRLFPNALVVGTDSPPFRDLTQSELRDQAARIKRSGAHIVWVGLGTPKQDLEAFRLAHELPLVFVAIGAAFDFVAGTKPQAPLWMQNNGLEWLFRLGSEPRRLWRRYVFGNSRFAWAAARQLLEHR